MLARPTLVPLPICLTRELSWCSPHICFDCRALLGDDNCFRRHVQHSDNHSRVEPWVPFFAPRWLGGRVQDLLPKLDDQGAVSPSMQSLERRLPVAANCTPVHQECNKLHQPARYPCLRRHFDANAVPQGDLQRPGLASHESHRALNDTIGLALSHGRSLRHGLTLLLATLGNTPGQRFDRWLTVTSQCDPAVLQLASKFRCSLCDPWALSPFRGTSIDHDILCRRSRMTSAGATCSSESLSPRNSQSMDTRVGPSTSY